MTIHHPVFREGAAPLLKPIDELLVDVAARIQLTPTLYRLAVERYETLAAWIDGEGSPLRGLVDLVYPQGSMGFGATIRSKDESDLFDIDVLVQARLSPGTTPLEALKLLERAIRRDPGSRYYSMTKRHTRCVTVTYAEMSLDFTIQERHWNLAERAGAIPHAKQEEPASAHKWVLTNPYGFAEWFKEQTPKDRWFASAFLARSYAFDEATMLAKADSEPVPDQDHLFEKPMALVSLQLLKRWLQRTYSPRPHRWPASILISKFVGESANVALTLSQSLIHHARHIRSKLESAQQAESLIVERNPALWAERFTDRWPDTGAAQQQFIADLTAFEAKMTLLSGDVDLEVLRAGLASLFGERAAGDAVRDWSTRRGEKIKAHQAPVALRTGRVLPAIATTGASSFVQPRPHRFYGGV